jgi:hypothetical protein
MDLIEEYDESPERIKRIEAKHEETTQVSVFPGVRVTIGADVAAGLDLVQKIRADALAREEARRAKQGPCPYCAAAVKGGAPWTHEAAERRGQGFRIHKVRTTGEKTIGTCLTEVTLAAACGETLHETLDSSD